MIRRQKTTIFIDAKESTPVAELKKMVQGMTKRQPENMRFFKDDMQLEDHKTLGDYGYTSSTARAQAPATVGLTYKHEYGRKIFHFGCCLFPVQLVSPNSLPGWLQIGARFSASASTSFY